MTKHATAANLSQFEAAPIIDAGQVEVVLRRRGPAILQHLSLTDRYAVATYTVAAEAVMAGGASVPRDNLTGGCSSGAPSNDGPQARAVDQVAFLRLMEAAVNVRRVFQVGKCPAVDVHTLDLWRKVCVGDMSMERYLAKMSLKPAKSRMAALNGAFISAASRVATAIGDTRSPF